MGRNHKGTCVQILSLQRDCGLRAAENFREIELRSEEEEEREGGGEEGEDGGGGKEDGEEEEK